MTEPDGAVGSELQDEPARPEILEGSAVFDGAVWSVRSERFRYGEETIVREFVDHPGAVVVVAVDEADRVLLIQQYRHPIRSRDWELPAGLRDVDGEEPVRTAQRELAEEADLHAEHWEPLLTTYSSPGGSNEQIHFFRATGLSAAVQAHPREAEEADIRLAWVPLSDAVDAVLAGRMHNALLAIGVLATAQKHRV